MKERLQSELQAARCANKPKGSWQGQRLLLLVKCIWASSWNFAISEIFR